MRGQAGYKPRITGPTDAQKVPSTPRAVLDQPLERRRTARNTPTESQLPGGILIAMIVVGLWFVGALAGCWSPK